MARGTAGRFWVEVDARGDFRRVSPAMDGMLQALDPPVRSLRSQVARRFDLATAIDRRAGRLRLTLGRGAQRQLYQVEVAEGMEGTALLRFRPLQGGEREVDALLDGWRRQNREGLLVADVDGHILHASRSFGAMLGYEPREIEGLDLQVLRAPSTPAEVWGMMDDALSTVGHWRGEVTLRRFDGTEVPMRVRATSVRVDGVVAGTVSTWEDVSLDREEDSLQRADRIADALEALARGVAHEVNNVATELVGWADVGLEQPDRAREVLEHERALGEALGEVGHHLLRLAGGHEDEGPVDLSALARDVGWTLERLARGAWPIEVEAAGPGPWIDGRAGPLQALALLLAYRAAERVGGREPIRVSAMEVDNEAALVLAFDADATERAALRRLVGAERLRPVVAARLQARAREAGVSLRLEEWSREVRLVLAAPAVLVCSDEEDAAHPARSRHGRILIAEDNDDLRDLLGRALSTRFPDVVTAADGGVAVHELERLEGRVDLVLSDVLLPVASGLEVYRRARQLNPDVRFLFVSGAAPTRELKENLRADHDAYLQKPFALADLLAAVDHLIQTGE